MHRIQHQLEACASDLGDCNHITCSVVEDLCCICENSKKLPNRPMLHAEKYLMHRVWGPWVRGPLYCRVCVAGSSPQLSADVWHWLYFACIVKHYCSRATVIVACLVMRMMMMMKTLITAVIADTLLLMIQTNCCLRCVCVCVCV